MRYKKLDSSLLRYFYEKFSPKTRENIKNILGANGHAAGYIDYFKAYDHARGKKRADIVVGDVVDVLKKSEVDSLMGRKCLEFGCGYVPTELLIYKLLGAAEVAGADYNAIANFKQLGKALALSDKTILIDSLAQFEDVNIIRRNVESLMDDIQNNSLCLVDNIKYLAPLDLTVRKIDSSFDFIHSVSVLEHISKKDIQKIMENLSYSLSENGVMIHEIDLRDHRDQVKRPFDFYSLRTDYVENRDADKRGNRILSCEWLDILNSVPGFKLSIVEENTLPVALLPKKMLNIFDSYTHQELATSRLVVKMDRI